MDLSSKGIDSVPAEIWSFTELEHLDLSNNNIKELPKEIGLLRRLKTLNLAHNKLESLPESIGELEELANLYLDDNLLQALPSSFSRLQNLYGAFLFQNCFSEFPEQLCHLDKLKAISIGCNEISCLPEEVARLKELRSLFLGANRLTKLPFSLSTMTSLEYLDISDNLISYLPKELGRLKQLKHFSFSGNLFAAVECDLPFWSLHPEFYPRPEMLSKKGEMNKNLSEQAFLKVYWRLGDQKWKEFIDGEHHYLGPEAFDLGLTRRPAEIGYSTGMHHAFAYLSLYFNRILDPDFYLEVHNIACSHFHRLYSRVNDRSPKPGVFRDRNWHKNTIPFWKQFDSERAMDEYLCLNDEIAAVWGKSFELGKMRIDREFLWIDYHTFTAQQVRTLFNYFLAEFYYEIGHSASEEDRLVAIARLFRNIEWLHPPADGCGRVDVAILNYLLVCYGFTPMVLPFPFVSSCQSFETWVAALKDGMEYWKTIK